MADRRSMSDAIVVDPEKVAFIHGKKPGDQAAESALSAEKRKSTTGGHKLEPSGGQSNGQSQPAKPTRTQPDHAARPQFRPILGEHLVPLTTRLQARTAEGLRRAYLEQKLRQVSPATQQEIVEEALHAWLEIHGYLSE